MMYNTLRNEISCNAIILVPFNSVCGWRHARQHGFNNNTSLISISPNVHREKNRLMTPEATFRAMPPEYNAELAKFEAWPNLSHREKATVFVIVSTSAITAEPSQCLHKSTCTQSNKTYQQASTTAPSASRGPVSLAQSTAQAARTSQAKRSAYPSR